MHTASSRMSDVAAAMHTADVCRNRQCLDERSFGPGNPSGPEPWACPLLDNPLGSERLVAVYRFACNYAFGALCHRIEVNVGDKSPKSKKKQNKQKSAAKQAVSAKAKAKQSRQAPQPLKK